MRTASWYSFLKNPHHRWYHILVVVAFLFVAVLFYSFHQKKFENQEGLATTVLDQSYSLKQGTEEIYDDFYAEIVDSLLPSALCQQQVEAIITNTQSSPQSSVILDIGSRRGLILQEWKRRGYANVYGIDSSTAMVKHTEKEVAENVVCMDALDRMNFDRATFSHILCLNQVLYEMTDLSLFFQNSRFWLKPGGYLVLHLVQYENMGTNKSNSVTLQLPSNNLQYVRTVEVKDTTLTIQETFTDKATKNVRQNENRVVYQDMDSILNTAVYYKFSIHGKISISTQLVAANTQEFLYFFVSS